MTHILFTAIRLDGGQPRDVLVADGRIAAITPPALPEEYEVVDGGGAWPYPRRSTRISIPTRPPGARPGSAVPPRRACGT